MTQLKIPFDPTKFKKPVMQRETPVPQQSVANFEGAHSFFFTDVIEAFVPNSLSAPAADQQFICRVKIVTDHFELAHKAIVTCNSTLQHESETLLAAATTRPNDYIYPSCTHPQPFYANNNFISKNGTYVESKQFPIGNSAYCDFNAERLYFLDTRENIAQHFIYYEIEQLPSWSTPHCTPLAFAVMRLSDFLQFQDQECDIYLFKYSSEQVVLARISYLRPMQKIEYSNEAYFAALFNYKTSMYSAGQLRVRIGFYTTEEIVQMRAARKESEIALFPHEVQRQKCDYYHEAQYQAENEFQGVDFDPYARRILDALHSDSLLLIKRVGVFEHSSQNKPLVSYTTGFGAFYSCSISAVALSSVGNVALGAAAVVGYNNVYNVVLFNVKSGDVISVLGSHFGYVYGLTFSPCGCYLASAAADGNIHIFKVYLYTFYGFHFWGETKLEDISQYRAELAYAFNYKESQSQVYARYKRFEALCDKNPDFKRGSIQLDIQCLQAVTRYIAACGPNLNDIVNSIEQAKVYDITKLVYLTTISVGLCVYEAQFLEMQDKAAAKPVSPQLVMEYGKYAENYKETLANYRLLYAGYNGQLICHYMVGDESTSQSLAQFSSYINTFAVENVRVKAQGADKRIFYVFTCEENGTARILKIDYYQNGAKKQETFYCPEGVKSAAFLDDCKKVLLYMQNGKLLLMDNGSKNKGAIVKDFQLPTHAQQLPGGCKICKIGGTAYVGCYGGKILAVSNTCNIVRYYMPFGALIGGLVPSCVAGSKFGVLACGFNILESGMVSQYVPLMQEHYINVPIAMLGCYTRYSFLRGQLSYQASDNDAGNADDREMEIEHQDEENRAQQDMIYDYLEFIRNANKDLK